MAAIDSLLRVLTSRNADALTLIADQAPRMTRAGATEPLTMPPLAAQLLETFLSEVLTPEQLAEAKNGPVTTDYGEFTATAKLAGGKWTLAFKKRPRRAATHTATTSREIEPPRAPRTPSSGAPDLGALGALGGSSPLASHLARAIDERATDLLLSSGRPARLRVGGQLVELPGAPPEEADLLELFAAALTPSAREQLERHGAT